MAASLIGQVEPFKPNTDDWEQYQERIEQYFMANGIEGEDKMRAVLLTVIGAEAYALLSNLVSPDKPATRSYRELAQAMLNHLKPKPLVIAERFRFHRRNQIEGERIAQYMAELRRLADRCKFGAHLEEALRDRLVCGLRSEQIQRRLLTMEALTLEKAYTTAVGMETADHQASELQASSKPRQAETVQQVRKTLTTRQPTKQTTTKQSGSTQCYRCGRANHPPDRCYYRKETCHKCGKLGHIAKVCRQSRPAQGTDFVETTEVEPEENEDELPLFNIQMVKPVQSQAGLTVEMTVEGRLLVMELDTGASVSLISKTTWDRLFAQFPLQPSTVLLKTYTGQKIEVLGERVVGVEYGGLEHRLPLVVVEGTGPTLFGRNWLEVIRLDWGSIKSVRSQLDQLLQKHEAVFRKELGTLKDVEAKLELQPDARSKFFKARSAPYALKGGIEKELDRLEGLGILEKVKVSDWASPLVPVPKPDGSVRLCGDFKVTINPVLQVDQYPMPTPEDLFATLAGGAVFSKLDLSNAYQQISLHPDSRKYVTVSTPKGLYQYTRLPFGVASAPAVFQRTMEEILQGIPGVVVYIDDILVTGQSEQEHLERLAKVLQRLEEHGLRVKQEKCRFMRSSVEYLGYRIDKDGLHPLEGKVAAIAEAPEPRDSKELRAFLGLVNYYGKFIKQLSTLTQPLNHLLCKRVTWVWNAKCREAFKALKTRLASSDVLVHYDPKLPLRLDCDASAYGVGAVLSHRFPDGTDRPIAYASRTLSPAERNYAQIEKEGLALIFGVKKFHKYVYGRQFTLVTDHKPLTAILGCKKNLPTLAAARLQRWAIFLLGYRYELEFRSTHQHANADGFSRLPQPQSATPSTAIGEVTVCNLHLIDSLPITAKQLREASAKENVLGRVLRYTAGGWPEDVPEELEAYHRHRSELSIETGCLLRGMRVVIPEKHRVHVLEELHVSHPGIVRMKGIARSKVWWPGIDADIESTVHNCEACQGLRVQPPPTQLHPWTWAAGPWDRVHVDFAGPFMGSMFLIVVDSHSKWLEVVPMTTTSAGKTVEVLRELFARYGVPQVLVSDNGPQFIAQEFAEFLAANGVKHLRGAPYHPATNGEAERFVQTFKHAMLKGKEDGGSLKQVLDRFLLVNRTAPHTTTGVPPAELFMKRQLRTRLDLLRPSVKQHVERKQEEQQAYHDRRARKREFALEETVLVRNFRAGPRWVRGQITEKMGAVSYRVKVGGDTWKRHADQLLAYRGQAVASRTGTGSQAASSSAAAMAEFNPAVVGDSGSATEPQVSGDSTEAGTGSETPPDTPSQSGPGSAGTPTIPTSPTPSTVEGSAPATTPSVSLPQTPQRNRVVSQKQYPRRQHRNPNWFEPTFQISGEEM